jgi:hypothetical protein
VKHSVSALKFHLQIFGLSVLWSELAPSRLRFTLPVTDVVRLNPGAYSCNVSLSGQYMAVKSTTNRCILLNGSLDVTPDSCFYLTGSLLFGP